LVDEEGHNVLDYIWTWQYVSKSWKVQVENYVFRLAYQVSKVDVATMPPLLAIEETLKSNLLI